MGANDQLDSFASRKSCSVTSRSIYPSAAIAKEIMPSPSDSEPLRRRPVRIAGANMGEGQGAFLGVCFVSHDRTRPECRFFRPLIAVRMAGGRVVGGAIENGRRAQINLVQRTDKIGEICIVCRVARCDTRMHFVEIFGDRPVTGDAADAGLPSMNMSINETGHDNLTGRVDDFRVGRPERFSDFLDFVPVDQNIAFLKIAHPAVMEIIVPFLMS